VKQNFSPASPAATSVNASAAAPATSNVRVFPTLTAGILPGPDIRAEFDEYAHLVESTKAPNARKEALRLRILAKFDYLAPEAVEFARGDVYELEIGAKGMERKVTALTKLCKYLTPKVFFSLCKITLEAFESHVTEADREQFMTEARTGGRRITCTKLFKEAA
jgi:hypothetical protein